MFGSSKAKSSNGTIKRLPLSREAAVTILTSGCHFSGKLYCRGASRIGGKIEGEIISEGLLIIEEGAQILASVTADDVVIQGYVNGSIRAKNRIEMAATCRFEGDVITQSLVVQDGAQFNGRSQMVVSRDGATGRSMDNITAIGGSRIPDLIPDPDQISPDDVPDVAMVKLADINHSS